MTNVQPPESRAGAQAIVEFALVVPLFLILLFALIDFGRLEFSYASLANAAREMARTAAISSSSNTAVIDGYNNFAALVLSPPVTTGPAADRDYVTITVADQTCAATAACGGLHVPVSVQCPLPLTTGTCSVPPRAGSNGGYVEVAATNHFSFNPVFQNRLTGMVAATFTQQMATLTTTARAYVE